MAPGHLRPPRAHAAVARSRVRGRWSEIDSVRSAPPYPGNGHARAGPAGAGRAAAAGSGTDARLGRTTRAWWRRCGREPQAGAWWRPTIRGADDVTLLERISGPRDLKDLSAEDLPQLAAEIRDYLIRVVTRNGGHLGPNLGVVELTIALYRV